MTRDEAIGRVRELAWREPWLLQALTVIAPATITCRHRPIVALATDGEAWWWCPECASGGKVKDFQGNILQPRG